MTQTDETRPKRANGEGGKGQLPDGTFYRTLGYTHPVTGKPDRKRFLSKASDAQALKKLKAFQALLKVGMVRESDLTLAEWAERWIKTTLESSENRRSTVDRDVSMLRKHVVGEDIGKIQLKRLTKSDIMAWKGRRRKVLAQSSLAKLWQILDKCLRAAVAEPVMTEHPMSKVEKTEKPTEKQGEMMALSVEQLKALFVALQSSSFLNILLFISFTGVRRGEAIALKWDQVDVELGAVKIHYTESRKYGRGDPKTSKGKRPVPMQAEVRAVLKNQRKRQLELRLKAGNAWLGEGGHVFTTASGRPYSGRDVLHAIEVAGRNAGLPVKINVHMLRHSVATTLIEQGWADKAVADLLGQVDTRTVARYTHPSDSYKTSAMTSLGSVYSPLLTVGDESVETN